MSLSGPASKRSKIDPFIVMDVMRAAQEREISGKSVLHMEVGQPGTPPPASIRKAAAAMLEKDRLGYTEALGITALRERIAAHYQDRYRVDVRPERVVVTTGSSAGFVLAFLAAFDSGARVALASPGYPCYRQIMKTLGMKPVSLATRAAQHWNPSPADLEAAAADGGLDGIILASPANPTGMMLGNDELLALIATAQALGAWYIYDEIYHGLTYEAPAQTALACSDNVIVINSFSKYYCMTGWRVGWMVVPEHLVRVIERLAQNLYIAAPTLSQYAALAAFDATEELEALKAVYARNRTLLLDELPRAGFSELVPADGAFYLYADVSRYTNDSLAFARRMLNETGVAVTPGLDFDPDEGGHFIRFSFAGDTADMREAARRLREWTK